MVWWVVAVLLWPLAMPRLALSGVKPDPRRTNPRPAGWVGLYARQFHPRQDGLAELTVSACPYQHWRRATYRYRRFWQNRPTAQEPVTRCW